MKKPTNNYKTRITFLTENQTSQETQNKTSMKNVQTLIKSKQNNTIWKLIRGGEQSTGGVEQRDWEVWRVVSGEQCVGGGGVITSIVL